MKRYVVGLLFSEDRVYLAMVEKNRPEWQAGLFNGIGGKIEPGEEPLAAMVREFLEETGVEFHAWEPFIHLAAERDRDTGDGDGYEIFFYKAFSNEVFRVETLTDEAISIQHVETILYNPDLAVRNMRWLLPLALDPYVNGGPGGSFIAMRDLGGN